MDLVAKLGKLFIETCFRLRIQLPPFIASNMLISSYKISFHVSTVLFRVLATAVSAIGPFEEVNSKTNFLAALRSSLKDLWDMCEDFKTAVNSFYIHNQNKENFQKLTIKLLFRHSFARGLLECLNEDDIACINRFKHDQVKILCYQFQLNEEMADHITRTDDITYESFKEQVKLILRDRYESLGDYTNNLVVFQKLGFTRAAAIALPAWTCMKETSHKNLLYWVFCFLESLHFDMLFPGEFPFNKGKINELYDIPVNGGTGTVSGINMFVKGSENKVVESIIDKLPKITAGESYWYHGTSVEHEKNIRRDGIELKHGKAGDFSKPGCGFYLMSNLIHALNYGGAKAMGRGIFTVLVFKVCNDFRFKFKGKDLTKALDLWREAIDFHRSCQAEPRNRSKEPRKLSELHFIEGPSSNYEGTKILDGMHQLCIRSHGMAEYFFSRLCCILYIKKREAWKGAD